MLDHLKALWYGEPALVASAIASLIVFAATRAGIVVDQQTVGQALLYIVPILLGGAATRQRVSPYSGDPGADSDALIPDDPTTPKA